MGARSRAVGGVGPADNWSVYEANAALLPLSEKVIAPASISILEVEGSVRHRSRIADTRGGSRNYSSGTEKR